MPLVFKAIDNNLRIFQLISFQTIEIAIDVTLNNNLSNFTKLKVKTVQNNTK